LQVLDAADVTAAEAGTGAANPGKASIVICHPGETNRRKYVG